MCDKDRKVASMVKSSGKAKETSNVEWNGGGKSVRRAIVPKLPQLRTITWNGDLTAMEKKPPLPPQLDSKPRGDKDKQAPVTITSDEYVTGDEKQGIAVNRAARPPPPPQNQVHYSKQRSPTIRSLYLLYTITVLVIMQLSTASAVSYRYASSSNRIYLEGGGNATLTDIKEALPRAPLDLVNQVDKLWYLRAKIIVRDGTRLALVGSPSGGDVDTLRLQSNDDPDAVVYIDADYGTINVLDTSVTSWDDDVGAPDDEPDSNGRAFIRARSRKVGDEIQESRLHVRDSTIRYLGVRNREQYGLTWQVVNSIPGVKVYGNVEDNVIGHCQLSVASWSVDDNILWIGNKIRKNWLYGFDESDPGHKQAIEDNSVRNNFYGPILRWASSSNRIYVTGRGVGTLSLIHAILPNAPLDLVEPTSKTWYLQANIFVEKGARLELHGSSEGGDVDELRLQSNNTPEPGAWVRIEADWGTIDIDSTKILSWDSETNGPDTEYEDFGRAHIRVRSRIDKGDGVTPRESRMDILSSDIGYLGFQGSEAYGLSWKVLGFTGDNFEIFDEVNAYGDIKDSRIHHNHFGVYTYGLEGGIWMNNEIDNNNVYGFDPHDDSDNIIIKDNFVHDNGNHGIIASKRCNGLLIKNNTSTDNGRNGIMLHRSSNDAIVEENFCEGNADSGCAIFASRDIIVRNNTFNNNGKYGIRLSVGSDNNTVEYNEIDRSLRYGIFLYRGRDTPEPGTDGINSGNIFRENVIKGAPQGGIRVEDSDNNTFVDNVFEDVGRLRLFRSLDNVLDGNIFVIDGDSGFPELQSVGDVTSGSKTVVMNQPYAIIRIDTYSNVIMIDEAGAAFEVEENLDTTVSTSGSFLVLDEAGIGSKTEVNTLPLFTVPDRGEVMVNPGSWDQDSMKWVAQADFAAVKITYSVGDLTPSASYEVFEDGKLLTSVVASEQGVISFDAEPESTEAVEYHVGDVRWVDITVDDFETGRNEVERFGNFQKNAGSSDAKVQRGYREDGSPNNQARYIPQGIWAARLRDNSGINSAMFHKKVHDVSGFTKLRVKFDYCARSFEGTEAFFLEYSSDGGSNYATVHQFINGRDFDASNKGFECNSNVVYELEPSSFTFSTQAKIQFRCDASGNGDYVYIDVVSFQGLP